MTNRRAEKYLFLPAACLVFLIQDASAADCRWHGRNTRNAIAAHVAALLRIEHEASDRIKGLDSRPFDVLLGEARKTMAIVAAPAALEDEKTLERCRNATRPIRKLCADAGQMLVDILDKHMASEKPEYDRPRYALLMAECAKAMDLKPLKSLIRGTD